MPNVLEATGDWSLSSYDHNFDDSVSMRSSTVVASEPAAERVRQHEMTQQFQVPIDQNPVTNVISLQIQVLNNGTLAASEVNNIEKVLSKNSSTKKIRSCARIRQHQCKILISLIILMVIGVIAVASVLVFNKKINEKENPSETETTDSTTEPTTTQATKTYTQPTTPSTTKQTETTSNWLPTTSPSPFKLVTRSAWDFSSIPFTTTLLKMPVARIIIMDTQSEPCHNVPDCGRFLRAKHKYDQKDYIERYLFKGIRENFFIAFDGTIYEARGFQFVGQHTLDQQLTDYNQFTIGISFIGNYSNAPLEPNQEESFRLFIKRNIELDRIKENYILYHRGQLSLNQSLSENTLYKTVQTWDHWKTTPAIISKKDWRGLPKVNGRGYLSDVVLEKVVVGHSNGSTCSDLASCSQIMRELQLQDRKKHGDVKHNFVLGGEDLIFQGKSFDYTSIVVPVSIDILFIGKYMDEQPPKSLMKAFEALLQFAVDLGKLTVDYKLYGQRQLIEDTESPGDNLYEALQSPPFDSHFDFSITTPEPCRIGCSIRM